MWAQFIEYHDLFHMNGIVAATVQVSLKVVDGFQKYLVRVWLLVPKFKRESEQRANLVLESAQVSRYRQVQRKVEIVVIVMYRPPTGS